MDGLSESLKYKRWYSPRCHALLSFDAKTWLSCDVVEISANSLKFETSDTYSLGERIYFRLILYSGCSEFEMKVQAKIVGSTQNIYEVQFSDILRHHQIQLDEIVKSNTQKNDENLNHYHKFEEGVYTFCFNPSRRNSVKLRKRL